MIHHKHQKVPQYYPHFQGHNEHLEYKHKLHELFHMLIPLQYNHLLDNLTNSYSYQKTLLNTNENK